MKKLLQIAIHPFFIYCIIFALECIPTDNAKVFFEFPKEGENFKTTSSDAVYYFTKNTKFQYTSEKCYFSLGNPPFSASYKQGGIKTISTKIAEQIPLAGNMCDETFTSEVQTKKLSFTEKYLTISYFLGNFSDFAHFFVYLILSFSIALHFKKHNKNYWFALLACFIGGAFLEGVQHYYIEGRTASYEDQILNTLGAIFGIIIYHFQKKNYFFKIKLPELIR